MLLWHGSRTTNFAGILSQVSGIVLSAICCNLQLLYLLNADADANADAGTKLEYYSLQQGLRIAPPEAPVTGYMFGKGIYFADMVSKSANYCCPAPDNKTGLLLLCEVALGDM
jgi:hypothetical protein